ncbi:hypothetical protein, partial [Streptosporangium sp. NPDC048865]|uniref:hypothetical protein n=1 Tax=Streptosporangium sp. NPDC048865 TaxID=3155766 RepID=UPI0034180043
LDLVQVPHRHRDVAQRLAHLLPGAEAVAAALRGAGAVKVWLAGKGEFEGVDANLYAGCDALGVLRTTFEDLGVAR